MGITYVNASAATERRTSSRLSISLVVRPLLRMDSFNNCFDFFLGTLKDTGGFDFVNWCVLVYVVACPMSFSRMGLYFVHVLLAFLVQFCSRSEFR
jgi:hypothetical protein